MITATNLMQYDDAGDLLVDELMARATMAANPELFSRLDSATCADDATGFNRDRHMQLIAFEMIRVRSRA